MARIKTSEDLIESVKRRAMLPEESSTFLAEDYLEILNEEFQIGILPKIMEVHEEYYVYSIDIPVVKGQKNYTIPNRSIGNKVRNVTLTNDTDENVCQLTRIDPEDIADYTYSSNAFYVQNNEIILINEPSSTYVTMDIYLRPNALVKNERGAKIKTIDTITGSITVATIPSNFGDLLGSGESELFDFVAKNAPNKIIDWDIEALSISIPLKTIVFGPDVLPTTLVAGDYIVWADETIVPQIPLELVPVLCQMGAIYCLESLGDAQGLALAEKKLAKMEKNSNTLIDNRTEGNPQKVVNRNSFVGRRNYKTRGY